MKPGTCFLMLCALLPAALAENMTLRSGRVLEDASVVSSGDDFVSVQYTDGVAKVSYKELTDAQQKDYRMTPEDVKARLDQRRLEDAARRKKAEEARKAADEEARKIRESLSEAERHPRYLEGADISRMFLLLGELSQVEAEVMALQWNALEADRVGLPEDARTFRARMGTYQEQVNAIRKKRETAEQYWQDLEKNCGLEQAGLPVAGGSKGGGQPAENGAHHCPSDYQDVELSAAARHYPAFPLAAKAPSRPSPPRSTASDAFACEAWLVRWLKVRPRVPPLLPESVRQPPQQTGCRNRKLKARVAQAADAAAPGSIPFPQRKGEGQIPGRGYSSMRPSWKEARCVKPAWRARSAARSKSRPTSSGLWASELMVRGIFISAAIFKNCASGYCSAHLLRQPAVLSSRQAPDSFMASRDGS